MSTNDLGAVRWASNSAQSGPYAGMLQSPFRLVHFAINASHPQASRNQLVQGFRTWGL